LTEDSPPEPGMIEIGKVGNRNDRDDQVKSIPRKDPAIDHLW
jgi:hypothetical protein